MLGNHRGDGQGKLFCHRFFVTAQTFAFTALDLLDDGDAVMAEHGGFQFQEEAVCTAQHGAAHVRRTALFGDQPLSLAHDGTALGREIVEQSLQILVLGGLRRLPVAFVAILDDADQVIERIDDLVFFHGGRPSHASPTLPQPGGGPECSNLPPGAIPVRRA